MDYSVLENRIGYRFKDQSLLVQALTHPSAGSGPQARIAYERFEFLGDAVLELAVSQELFTRLPESPEGVLTHLRARIVSRQHFHQMALELGLDQWLILGKGEEQTGGRTRLSNLANTFETVLGAILLDSDYETARAIAHSLLADSISEAARDLKEINPKGELQSTLQDIFPESPIYATQEINPVDGALDRFQSSVSWRQKIIGQGVGASKRKAEVAAASDAIQKKLWLSK